MLKNYEVKLKLELKKLIWSNEIKIELDEIYYHEQINTKNLLSMFMQSAEKQNSNE